MNKMRLLSILLIMTILLTSGCWDRRELENLGIVQALGLDLESGHNDEVTVTTMIAIPSELGGGQTGGGGGGGGDKPGVLMVSMKAPSIYEAFNRINTLINREVSLLQNQVLIIGEELAKNGAAKWIDNLIRFREMRRTMLVFVCKGRAADIMKVQPKLEKKPSEYFTDLAAISRRTGMFPLVTLNDFLKRYEAYAHENYLPFMDKHLIEEGGEKPSAEKQNEAGEKGENNGESKSGQDQKSQDDEGQKLEHVRFIGSAIFKKDRMVGNFDIYETQILLLLNNEFKEALLTIEDPLRKDYKIIFRLLSTVPVQIQYRPQNGVDHFKVKLRLEADLVSIQSGIDYTRPKLEAFLGRVIAKELKHRVVKAIKKAQQEFNSDVFGFGEKVRSTFITSSEYEKYNWPDKFQHSRINVQVKVDLRRVGVQFQPPENR
jgi:spore germination protein KC